MKYLQKSVWLFVHVLNLLCWPALASLLDAPSTGQEGAAPPLPKGHDVSAKPLAGQHILDIACGNGLTSRRLAALGAQVTAFDFSANLIEKAKARSTNLQSPIFQSLITHHVIDAPDEQELLSLGEGRFDAALSNMALFDMANKVSPVVVGVSPPYAGSATFRPTHTILF